MFTQCARMDRSIVVQQDAMYHNIQEHVCPFVSIFSTVLEVITLILIFLRHSCLASLYSSLIQHCKCVWH